MCHLRRRLRIFYFVEKLSSVLKIFKFLYFKQCHDLPNLWRHAEYEYMGQGVFLNILFESQLVWITTIWKIDRYKQGQKISGILWTIWWTGARFQVLFNLAICSNYLITNYVKIPVFHIFEKVNKGQLKSF